MVRWILLAALLGVLLSAPIFSVQATTVSFGLTVPAVRHIVVDARGTITGVWDTFTSWTGPCDLVVHTASLDAPGTPINARTFEEYRMIASQFSDTVGWVYHTGARSTDESSLFTHTNVYHQDEGGVWHEVLTVV